MGLEIIALMILHGSALFVAIHKLDDNYSLACLNVGSGRQNVCASTNINQVIKNSQNT